MSIPEPGPFEACRASFQSVSSVSLFAFIVLILEVIALPGMKGGPAMGLLAFMGATVAFGFFGLLLGGFGQRLCRAPVNPSSKALRIVAWLSLLHLPFGTVAGVRTLLALRKAGAA